MIYKLVIVYRIYDEKNPSKNPLALSSWPLALGSSNGKGKVFQPLIHGQPGQVGKAAWPASPCGAKRHIYGVVRSKG